MATITLTATGICSGGDHVRIRLDINGVAAVSKVFLADDLIAAIDDVDALDVIRTLIRLHKIGRTLATVKADLQAGLTITV